jgi:tRNA (guanine-N7-)-methyltransferase
MIEIKSPFFLKEETLSSPTDFSAIFGNQNPLVLEIGCGIGDFMAQLAANAPERNFLAIDIYNKGCNKTCNRLEKEGLTNVRVMRIEARYLLSRYLIPECLAAVYINCPDPWPKKRHLKRRLVNRLFLQTLLHYLRPDGELFFSSDVADYAHAVAAALEENDGFDNQLATPISLNMPGYPLSKYMRRFLAQDQSIHFLHYRRNRQHACEAAPPQPAQRGFRIAWSGNHG